MTQERFSLSNRTGGGGGQETNTQESNSLLETQNLEIEQVL